MAAGRTHPGKALPAFRNRKLWLLEAILEVTLHAIFNLTGIDGESSTAEPSTSPILIHALDRRRSQGLNKVQRHASSCADQFPFFLHRR